MDKAMEALKPCPHCGKSVEWRESAVAGEGGYARCHTCSDFSYFYFGSKADAIAAWNTRATPEPVAPTPSPDIAGLVERAKNYVNDPDQLEHCDPKYLSDDLEEFATALHRVAQERDALKLGNDSLVETIEIIQRSYAERESLWNNMQERFSALVASAEAAEAHIATARDERLEEVAEWLHQNGPHHPSAGIHALKGTKP